MLFLFVRDPSLEIAEQMELPLILREVFQGLSIPRGASTKLAKLYESVMNDPPRLDQVIRDVSRDFEGQRDALIALCKVLLRLISDDGMISNRHSSDLREVLREFEFSLIEFEEFQDSEKAILEYALGTHVDAISSPPDLINHYCLILGCSPETSLEELRRTYRNHLMQFHPDRRRAREEGESQTRQEEIAKKLADIQEAYQFLAERLIK